MAEVDEKEGRKGGEKARFYNLVASLADKELREGAEHLADFLSRYDFLRSDAAERAWGVGKSWIESLAKARDNPLGKTALEKLSDFLDFTSGALYREDRKPGATTTRGTGRSRVRTSQDWMDEFAKYAENRIKKAKTPEQKREARRLLKLEFDLQMSILEMIDKARKESQPAEEKKSETTEPLILDKTKSKIAQLFTEFEAELNQSSDWMEQRIQTLKARR